MINNESFNLKELVNEVHEFFAYALNLKHLDFKLHFKENIPFIVSDRERVMSILINLLSNSQKFTLKGQIEISIFKSDADFI